MHIQLSEAMFDALTASQLGYIMKQRGEVQIKVKYKRQWIVNYVFVKHIFKNVAIHPHVNNSMQ